jgi:hypothetical protein
MKRMLVSLFFMFTIKCGDLVEINPADEDHRVVGLVLDKAEVKKSCFYRIRYVEEGFAETRWINQIFIKEVDSAASVCYNSLTP